MVLDADKFDWYRKRWLEPIEEWGRSLIVPALWLPIDVRDICYEFYHLIVSINGLFMLIRNRPTIVPFSGVLGSLEMRV